MSGSTSAPDAAQTTPSAPVAAEKAKAKKIKYGVAFGYVGEQYYGLQYNHDPAHPSVESVILKAFHNAGMISDENMEGNTFSKLSWQRASRTDKGVHALRNLISVKLIQPADNDIRGAVAKINSFLPKDIRVFDLQPVTSSFNSKLFCSGRRYEYHLPTFALMNKREYDDTFLFEDAPEDPDSDKLVQEQDGAAGGGGAGGDDDGGDDDADDNTDNNNNNNGEKASKADAAATSAASTSAADGRAFAIRAEPGTRCPNPDDSRFYFNEIRPELMTKLAAYRITPQRLEHARRLFKEYEGTHSFHNFTPRGRPTDKSMMRFITSLTVSEPFVAGYDGAEEREVDESDPIAKENPAYKQKTYDAPYTVEWVKIELVGQSFMLNQIRKMIGCVCSVFVSGVADSRPDGGAEFMRECLSKKVQRGMPMAPANGLFLVNLFFDRYKHRLENLRSQIKAQGRDAIDFDATLSNDPDALFVRRRVLQVISRRETNEDITGRWMLGMRYILKLAWGVCREHPEPLVVAASSEAGAPSSKDRLPDKRPRWEEQQPPGGEKNDA